MASNLREMGFQPKSDGLHPSILRAMASNLREMGFQPKSDGLHPSILRAMASNLREMASNLRVTASILRS